MHRHSNYWRFNGGKVSAAISDSCWDDLGGKISNDHADASAEYLQVVERHWVDVAELQHLQSCLSL